MKNIILFLTIISFSINALEIQCQTNHAGVEAVIKTSENTGITYVVIFEGEKVTPIPLRGDIVITNESIKYQSENANLTFNRTHLFGQFVIDQTTIELFNCNETDLNENE